MALAENTLRIQLIVLRIELEGYIVLLLVGHHQVEVFAARAAYESGLARIESQNIHSNPVVLMKDCTASLLTHQAADRRRRWRGRVCKPRQRCQCLIRKDRLNGE